MYDKKSFFISGLSVLFPPIYNLKNFIYKYTYRIARILLKKGDSDLIKNSEYATASSRLKYVCLSFSSDWLDLLDVFRITTNSCNSKKPLVRRK